VRFTTAAALVNQLVEAQREHSLSRMLARWSRVELIVIDELGYVPLAEVAAELLFQVIAERAEKAAVIVTTNLPFSEWPQVFTNARLCKAMLDRLTDQAHIIETGSESYRFRRTLRKKTKTKPGCSFCFRSALRATLQQNRTPATSTSTGWANLNRRSGPSLVAKVNHDDNDSLAGLIVTFFSGICLEQKPRADRARITKKIDAFMRLIRAI